MAFDDLKMSSKSHIKLSTQRSNFAVQMRKDVTLAPDSVFDFSNVAGVIINSTDTNTRLELGNIVYKRGFGIHGKHVKLLGKVSIYDRPKHELNPLKKIEGQANERKSRIMMKIDENLELGGSSSIESGHILLQANGTISSESGFSMHSYRNNTCNTDKGKRSKDLFTCVPHKMLDPVFT